MASRVTCRRAPRADCDVGRGATHWWQRPLAVSGGRRRAHSQSPVEMQRVECAFQ